MMWSSFVFVAVVLAVGGDEPQEACVVDGTATVRILRDVACVAEASGSSLGPLFRKRLVESAGPCFRDVVDDALDDGDASAMLAEVRKRADATARDAAGFARLRIDRDDPVFASAFDVAESYLEERTGLDLEALAAVARSVEGGPGPVSTHADRYRDGAWQYTALFHLLGPTRGACADDAVTGGETVFLDATGGAPTTVHAPGQHKGAARLKHVREA